MYKKIIAPQIVVYKNALSSWKEILNSISDKSSNILTSDWEAWYENGYRSNLIYDKNNTSLSSTLSTEIVNAYDELIADYFNDFGGSNGIWPEFIKDWDFVKGKRHHYNIDFFRYDQKKSSSIINQNGLLMDYHVDEFLIDGLNKKEKNIVTVNFYLNDEYFGGEICAYDSLSQKNYVYKPKPGDAVVMPSTSPFYHGVKPFYGSDRYFCRLFVTYTDNSQPHNSLDQEAVMNHLQTIEEENYRKKHLQTIVVNAEEIVVGDL